MEVRVVGSCPDSPRTRQYASSYLVNGKVCIDAGCIGFWGSPEQQSGVGHILLTHTHMDHTASLPVFLDNAFDPATEPVVLHATEGTLAALQAHLFNGVTWPDFLNLAPGGRAFARTSRVTPGQEMEVEGLRILPVPVDHQVPTVGYIVSDGSSTVVFGADSAPTEAIWQAAREYPAPRSVFLETSFPNSMKRLAELSFHLTPEMVGAEYAKMPPVENVFIIHIKPRFRAANSCSMAALRIPGLTIVDGGEVYSV